VSTGPTTGVLDAAAIGGLKELVGDDPEALAEIVDAFLEEGPLRVEELASDDATVVGRAAHTLKSNAATFGATSLEALTRDLEARARAQDLANTDQLVASITAEWERVSAALRELRG
jgi:HPt (histidine-containing phosphotransfer) domain-containing protein